MLKLITDTSNIKKAEDAYISVRKSEGRLYTDEEILQLPDLPSKHPNSKEWQVRKNSLKLILKYLQEETSARTILDIGCGNGWMSNQLQKAGFAVTGLDINETELKQATILFPEIRFVYADVFEKNNLGCFDVVLLSASFQYFPDAIKLINHLKQNYLEKNGIILIADTNFYRKNELHAARKRSENYYKNMNTPQMAKYYFHHAIETFHPFNYRIINKRGIFDSILSKLKNHPQPFQLFVIY